MADTPASAETPGQPAPEEPAAQPPPEEPTAQPAPQGDERTPTHTVYLHNLDYKVTYDDLVHFCQRYGTVKDIWYPLSRQGMAFCTFYDIRAAIRCVKEGNGRPIRRRNVKTNFAFKPPAHSKRDPKAICSTILVKCEEKESPLPLERIKTTMKAFGEIRSAEERAPGEYVLKFYDLQEAAKCAEAGRVHLKGVNLTMEMLPEEDLGDENVAPRPPRENDRRDRRDSRRHEDDRPRRYDDPPSDRWAGWPPQYPMTYWYPYPAHPYPMQPGYYHGYGDQAPPPPPPPAPPEVSHYAGKYMQ